MTRRRTITDTLAMLGAIAGFGLAFAGPADATATAAAMLKGPDGAGHGTVELTETAHGVWLKAKLTGLPPGIHGFHIHETGACTPDFKAAGGHYNPAGTDHGVMTPGGMHAGDMPNIHVPESGELTVELLNDRITLDPNGQGTLRDGDGSAIVIHASADDYESQPSGAAGDRIACGVID